MDERLERLLGPLLVVAGMVLLATGDHFWGVVIAAIGLIGIVMLVLGRHRGAAPGDAPGDVEEPAGAAPRGPSGGEPPPR